MKLEQVIEKMERNKWALSKGKGSLAKDWHCSESDIVYAKQIVRKRLKKKNAGIPKILIFDIETSPMKAWVWGRWHQDVYLNQTISEWFTICWSAKWLYSDTIMSECLTPDEILKEDDSRIVKRLWELFDEADIIVAHNGSEFDIPKMNSRFIINELNPPTNYFVVDTRKVAQRVFGFSSNKLDALAGYFGIEHKMETDFDLWAKCLEGDQQSLDYMVKYNKKDVEILEQVYLKLRPYVKGHPNVSLLVNKNCCSHCGNLSIKPIEGKFYYTSVSKFQLYRCPKCGAIIRGRKNLADKVATVSTAR